MKRIEQAIDLATGEEIQDICVYFGLPSLKPAELQMPKFCERPLTMSAAESQNLRKADRRALFGPFRLAVIAEARRVKLWASFDSCCFRCKAAAPLEFDHHIPQYLGGRLVPGNVVLLCARCNSEKRERHPSEFYPEEQLAALNPILQAQLALFDFQFDWGYWGHRPHEYLVSLGIPDALAQAVLTDAAHPYYVGRASDEE